MKATIDRDYGACRCWICRRAFPSAQERDWLTKCLARDLARKPASAREVWLANYALRHGKIITQRLRDAIAVEEEVAHAR